jgi:ERO1-like protein alpha
MLSYIIPSALYCQLCRTAATEGSISDCSCDFDTVDTATHDYYHPLLRRLQSQKFFRFFKINLDESCPFWDDSDSMCAMKDCSVETCKSDEVPLPWRAEDKSGAVSSGRNSSDSVDSGSSESSSGSSDGKPPLCKPVDSVYSAESEMDRKSLLAEQNVERATARIFDGSLGVSRWNEGGDDSDVWIEQDEATGMVYVDLEQNPERFTGYTGDSPHRIWQAIYEENCFESSDEENSGSQCFEKRIFYRLISGMQASITTHIAKGYFYGTNCK